MLKGVKVLDLSRFMQAAPLILRSGPLCTAMLADQGAQVIKIENTTGDGCRLWGPPFHKDGTPIAFDVPNRSKKSIVLNFKKEKHQEVLKDLAAKSDILVENFKAGTLDRLNCGYETLKPLNSRLIYCSITGYGPEGPLSGLGGFDTTLQAYSGLVSTTGPIEQPFKIGISVTDILCSYIAVGCIGQALYQRQLTGRGFKIDTSLLQAALYSLGINAQAAMDVNYEFKRTGNGNFLLSPQGIYHSKEGVAFFLACGSQPLYQKVAHIIGFELKEEFDSNSKRRDNWDKFDKVFRAKMSTFGIEYLETEFMKASIPFSRINSIAETVKQPQVKALGAIVKEESHPQPRSYISYPATFSEVESVAPTRSPALGEHTAEVLRDVLGYSEDKIAEVMKDG